MLPAGFPDGNAGVERRVTSEPSNPLWGDEWPQVRAAWTLDSSVAHLNHGAFGAVPGAVQETGRRIRQQVEANPNRFFARTLEPLLAESRQRVATFLDCDLSGLAFVTNATIGVAVAVNAVEVGEGDEILITDHAFHATRHAAEEAAQRSGARLTTVAIALPEAGTTVTEAEEHIIATVLGAVTDHTVLAVIDHITSPTALRMPVRRLCDELRRRGVLSLVDAAHAPGTLAEGPTRAGADFWVGNFHKWPCSPRGATALVVHPDQRPRVRALATASEAPAEFPANMAWHGAGDYSAYLCVPAALDILDALGWERLRTHNRALVRYGALTVSEALGTAVGVADGMFEAMALVALPPGVATDREAARHLARRVAEEASTEVAVVAWGGRGWLRLSAFAYNHPGEYETLAAALPRLLA